MGTKIFIGNNSFIIYYYYYYYYHHRHIVIYHYQPYHPGTVRMGLNNLDQFWFQLMHHNFTLLTKSLYMFRSPTCPSSGAQTIHTPQLVQRQLL